MSFQSGLLDIIRTKHYIIEIGDNEFRIAIFPDDQDEDQPCMSCFTEILLLWSLYKHKLTKNE